MSGVDDRTRSRVLDQRELIEEFGIWHLQKSITF